MSTTEKYISNAKLRDKPKKSIGLVLKDGSVTSTKIADKSISLDKLDKHIQDRIVNKTLDAYVEDEKLILNNKY